MTTNLKKIINKYWSYEICQNAEIKQEHLDGYKQKGRFYDDAVYYYELMQITPHHCMKPILGKESVEPNVISFLNVLIDINTIKILFALLPNSKIVTLKFCSNNFEYKNLEELVNSIMTKNNNVYNLIFEWNYLIKNDERLLSITEDYLSDDDNNIIHQSKMLISKLSTHDKLDSLCLRGNFLGDEAGKIIFDNLKNNHTLRILNLYKNNFTTQCIQKFCTMLEFNKKLEEINLGNNYFIDEDLELLRQYIGKIPLTNEEAEFLLKKMKERDEIMEKNKKLKSQKKAELAVPHIEEITLIDDKYYKVRNSTLRALNIMQNKFGENVFSLITSIIDNSEDLLITIDSKYFTKEEKEKLTDTRSSYAARLYLSK